MKKFLLISAIMAFAISAFSQVPFKVITVNGEIVATKANLTLENGVEVSSDDNFEFIRPNSRAAMINSERGRIVLTEQNATDAFSRAAFAPAMSAVSARSGSVASLPELQSIFSDKMLIIDQLEIQIGAEYFPMEEENFFFVRYIYNDETINKQLPYKDDILIIDKEKVFIVDGKPIEMPGESELALYYYKKADDEPESILINSFKPIFMPKEQLKPEVQVIVDEFKDQSSQKVFDEVYDYLSSFYAKIEASHLKKWLKEDFSIDI